MLWLLRKFLCAVVHCSSQNASKHRSSLLSECTAFPSRTRSLFTVACWTSSLFSRERASSSSYDLTQRLRLFSYTNTWSWTFCLSSLMWSKTWTTWMIRPWWRFLTIGTLESFKPTWRWKAEDDKGNIIQVSGLPFPLLHSYIRCPILLIVVNASSTVWGNLFELSGKASPNISSAYLFQLLCSFSLHSAEAFADTEKANCAVRFSFDFIFLLFSLFLSVSVMAKI